MLLHVLRTFLQPPSGIWGLQSQRNTCTHLSASLTSNLFISPTLFLPFHCASLRGILGFLCILLAVPWTAVEWGLELMIQSCFRGKNQALKSSAGSSSHPLLSHQNSVILLDPKFRIKRTRRVFLFDQGLCSHQISECTNSRLCCVMRNWRMLLQ